MRSDVANVTNTESTSSIIVPVLLSGAIGAGLALLLTPKSGKDLRSDIGRFASRSGEQASETIEQGKQAATEAFSTGQENLSDVQEEISDITSSDEGRSLVVPILVSGVVGAAIALLFAPKSGSEIVGDIKDYASQALDKSKGWYEQGAQAVKDAVQKGKEAAAETKEKMRPAA